MRSVLIATSLLLLSVPAMAAPKPEGFQKLVEFIASKGISDPDDLLRLMPQEMKRNYVLMYETGSSTQNASPQKPRIILYSTDAKLLIAFAGDAAEAGGNRVEVAELDEKTEKPVFSSITFGKKGSKPDVRHGDKDCQQCHGSRSKWIWDSYPEWRFTYGSLHVNSENYAVAASREAADYSEYLANRLKGRHRFLPAPVAGNAGANGFRKDGPDDLSFRLNILNFNRIARDIETSPGYRKYKYALAAIALECTNLCSHPVERQVNGCFSELYDRLGFFIDVDEGKFNSELKNLATQSFKEMKGDAAIRSDTVAQRNFESTDFSSRSEAQLWAAYRTVLRRTGYEWLDMTTARTHGEYRVHHAGANGGVYGLGAVQLERMMTSDPELRAILGPQLFENSDPPVLPTDDGYLYKRRVSRFDKGAPSPETCQTLLAKSRKAIQEPSGAPSACRLESGSATLFLRSSESAQEVLDRL